MALGQNVTAAKCFLHMERWKSDLTLLSLSFSLFLIRGNIFREAFYQHRGDRGEEGEEKHEERKDIRRVGRSRGRHKDKRNKQGRQIEEGLRTLCTWRNDTLDF